MLLPTVSKFIGSLHAGMCAQALGVATAATVPPRRLPHVDIAAAAAARGVSVGTLLSLTTVSFCMCIVCEFS